MELNRNVTLVPYEFHTNLLLQLCQPVRPLLLGVGARAALALLAFAAELAL